METHKHVAKTDAKGLRPYAGACGKCGLFKTECKKCGKAFCEKCEQLAKRAEEPCPRTR